MTWFLRTKAVTVGGGSAVQTASLHPIAGGGMLPAEAGVMYGRAAEMAYLTPEELRSRFTEAGYAEVAEELIRSARRAVGIKREKADDAEIPVGASKLGGLPDLPRGTEWPGKDGRPMAFLAQFALADVPVVEGEPRLPREGLLSFFYWTWEGRWGYDPKDRGCWRVLRSAGSEELVRTEAPEGAFATEWTPEEDEPFAACRVGFEVVTTYPDLSDETVRRDDGEKVIELYHETAGMGQGEESPLHHLLGYPFVVQNPMEMECQLVSHGIYCGRELSAEDKEIARTLEEGAKDWTLLLQLDSDDDAEWMWRDVGILYFWIRRRDLEAGEFGEVWVVLQCY